MKMHEDFNGYVVTVVFQTENKKKQKPTEGVFSRIEAIVTKTFD